MAIMAIKLPYVMEQKRKNGVDFYYRRGGALQKIEGDPRDWAAFFAAYQQIHQRAEDAAAGIAADDDEDAQTATVNDLIAAYRRMPEFLELSPRCHDDYGHHLDRISARWGQWTVAACEDPGWKTHVYAWRDQLLQSSKRQTDYTIQVLKRLISVCCERNMIGYNHVSGIKLVYKADRVDKRWTLEQVEHFMRTALTIYAGETLGWAMLLALHTGQRKQDLLALPWSADKGDVLRVCQLKGRRGAKRERAGVTVEVPISPAFRAVLDGIPRRSPVMLTAVTGIPWQESNFDNRWREVTLAAGLDGLHFHDIRGTTVTLLADCTCTEAEIAAITGHSLRSVHAIMATYLGRTRTQAINAVAKFSASWVHGLQTVTATRTATG